MSSAGLLLQRRLLLYILSAIVLLLPAAATAQRKPAASAQKSSKPAGTDVRVQGGDAFDQLDKKYPGLLDEFSRLLERLQGTTQSYAPRGQGELFKMMPESTVFYFGLPNYGNAVHRAVGIFREELQQSQPLRDWWRDTAGADGKKIEDGLEKFSELAQYLGDEIVISSQAPNKEFSASVMAEIRKPGIQDLIAKLNKDYAGKSPVRVFDPQQLAAEKNLTRNGEPVVLIRPDVVIAALDIKTLRSFNTDLEHNRGTLANTDFGRRLGLAYQNKAVTLMGADLQKLITQAATPGNMATLRETGFADAKYAIWETRTGGSGDASVSSLELSFKGPRHGPASWLGSSGQLGALDFMSPEPVMVYDLKLKNPAKVFDELREIVTASNPSAFAALDNGERGLNISIRNDVLAKLGGEVAVEMGAMKGQTPNLKILLSTNDAAGLQATLEKLLASAGMRANSHTETGDGFPSYSIRIPGQTQAPEVHYAFVDKYILITLGQEELSKAVQMHRTGTSLAKTQALRADSPAGSSGVIYHNMAQALAPALREAPPEYAQLLSRLTANAKPTVMHLYGEEDAIRVVSHSGPTDPSMALVIAAVAIPNFLRSKMKTNEAAAASTVRTVNTAQVTYASIYPSKGYAPDLATLGPGGGDCVETAVSEEHACLLDMSLGGIYCTSGRWCRKGDYRYAVSASCKGSSCQDYLVVATPADAEAGATSFCSVSDAVVRSKSGPPLSSLLTPAECRSWSPLH